MFSLPTFSKVRLSERSGYWVCTIIGAPATIPGSGGKLGHGGSVSLAVLP